MLLFNFKNFFVAFVRFLLRFFLESFESEISRLEISCCWICLLRLALVTSRYQQTKFNQEQRGKGGDTEREREGGGGGGGLKQREQRGSWKPLARIERKIDVEKQSVRVGRTKKRGRKRENCYREERFLGDASGRPHCSALGLARYRVKIVTRFHLQTTIIATNRCLFGESLVLRFSR